MNQRKLRIGLNLAIIFSCLIGVLLQLLGSANFMGAALVIFRAFTVQSNVWVAVIATVFLVADLKHKYDIPQWIYHLKYMFTVSILLTYTVFAVILSPVMTSIYLWSPSNWFLHSFTPIFSLASFLLLDAKHIKRGKPVLLALIMPIGYAIFFLSYYHLVGSQPVSYFFLDYKVLGWFTISSSGLGVAYWIMLISLLILGFGYGVVYALHRLKNERTKTKIILFVAISMLGLSLMMTLLNPLFK